LCINKPLGCGGQGLDYKFQVENSNNRKGWSFGFIKTSSCVSQGMDYKFQKEKSNN
jgi:hypothetical protein